jgi:hypothetical protein
VQLVEQVVDRIGEGVQLVATFLKLILYVLEYKCQHGCSRCHLLYNFQQCFPTLLSAVELSLPKSLRHDRSNQLGQLVLERVLRELPQELDDAEDHERSDGRLAVVLRGVLGIEHVTFEHWQDLLVKFTLNVCFLVLDALCHRDVIAHFLFVLFLLLIGLVLLLSLHHLAKHLRELSLYVLILGLSLAGQAFPQEHLACVCKPGEVESVEHPAYALGHCLLLVIYLVVVRRPALHLLQLRLA